MRGSGCIEEPNDDLADEYQRRDGTGLLYYHARYYDPTLGRFLSGDSVVPGSPSGSMDGIALKPLTVDFHEPGFAAQVGDENRQGFWFQLSSEERQQTPAPWGPRNAQALNRYSYVQNNPLRYTDPTGHDVRCPVTIGETAWSCSGGKVFNESDEDVIVVGERDKRDERGRIIRDENGDPVWEQVKVVLKPGQDAYSDHGIVDVDYIQPYEGQISGHGSNDVFKVPDYAEVHITNGGNKHQRGPVRLIIINLWVAMVTKRDWGWRPVAVEERDGYPVNCRINSVCG